MTAELEVIGSGRILAGTRSDVQVRCYRDGELVTPTGTLTFAVVDIDGNAVASGTPTASGGVLTAVLTAAEVPSPARLTVTWGGLVFGAEPVVALETQHEAVGAWLFSIAEARAFPKTPWTVQDYPDELLIEGRDRVTEQLEQILGYPLGAKYIREVRDGDGVRGAWASTMYIHELAKAETRDTTWAWTETSDELAFTDSGEVLRASGNCWPRGRQNVRLSYIAGLQPIPLELRRAGLLVLQLQLTATDVNQRATSLTNEFGNVTLATPGVRGSWFGLPEADAILSRHARKLLGSF